MRTIMKFTAIAGATVAFWLVIALVIAQMPRPHDASAPHVATLLDKMNASGAEAVQQIQNEQAQIERVCGKIAIAGQTPEGRACVNALSRPAWGR
jgi:hypothetical protein